MINGSAINANSINAASGNEEDLSAYKGCVKITYGISQGSGALLWNGAAIITAAHVVDAIPKGSEHLIGIEFFDSPSVTCTVTDIVIHSSYTEYGYDLAVLILQEPVDVSIPRYKLYESADELGKVFSRFAYSPIVNPATGVQVGGSEFRKSKNKYEATSLQLQSVVTLEGDQLVSDFDNGLSANNVLNGLLQITDAGIVGESGSRPGESGSPTFFSVPTVDGYELRIVGVTRGIYGVSGYDVSAASDGSYGELNFDTRVSSFTQWIRSAVGALDGALAVAQSASFTAKGDVTYDLRNALLATQGNAFASVGGAVLFGVFDNKFTATASAWSTGTLTVSTGATFENDSDGFRFEATGGGIASLTQFPATVVFNGAGSTAVGIAFTVPSFAAIGDVGTVGSFAVLSSMAFSASGAGHLSVSEPLGAFTSIALTGAVASATLQQASFFSATGNVVEALATLSVAQPDIVAHYGALLVEQSQMFSGGAVAVENNLVAYSMNIKTAETTTYQGFDFKYIVRLGYDYYGVKDDGLYRIGGDLDDGTAISASVTTAETDFGTSYQKRVPFVYMDLETDAEITPVIDGVIGNAFSVNFNGRKTSLARGYRGRYWQMAISNVTGGDLKISSLEMITELSSRKI